METHITVPDILAAKSVRKLVMVTAADAPSAAWADAAGVDLILVGDSLAMAALGRPHTLTTTLAEMAHHVRAVTTSPRRALVVGDLPFGSYQASVAQAVGSACELVAAGAAAVKLEGPRAAEVAAIVAAGIPVVGHLGLTPQSLHLIGGYRVQGKEAAAARRLLEQARELEAAGAFAVVLEAVPPVLGARITQRLAVPTIGIGAGPDCDGQVLVYADLLGFASGPQPRFVRRYAELGAAAIEAIRRFAADVRDGRYPAPEESYPSPAGLEEALAAGEEA